MHTLTGPGLKDSGSRLDPDHVDPPCPEVVVGVVVVGSRQETRCEMITPPSPLVSGINNPLFWGVADPLRLGRRFLHRGKV